MGYDVILLDADGTLLDFQAAQRQAFFSAMREMGVPADSQMLEQYDRINRMQWERLERGEVSRQEMLSERFALLFSAYGLERNAQEANRAYGAALCEAAPLLDGAKRLLQALAPVAELAIVTNGVAHSQRRRFALSGIDRYAGHIFISGEVGYEKPDPRFFEAVLRDCQVRDLQCVLVVGDSLSADIAGANAAGLDSCWFNPNGHPPSETAVPTYMVSSLAEVAALVWHSQGRELPAEFLKSEASS